MGALTEVLGMVLFAESLGPLAIAGIWLIIGGVVLVERG